MDMKIPDNFQIYEGRIDMPCYDYNNNNSTIKACKKIGFSTTDGYAGAVESLGYKSSFLDDRFIGYTIGLLHEDYRMTIKNVIFNPPATIVYWADGSKTVVKANNEEFDREKGLAMAISKRALGNTGNYFEEFKKWVGDEQCRSL